MDRLPYLAALLVYFFAAFQVQRRIAASENFWRISLEAAPMVCVLILLGVGLFGRLFHSFDRGALAGGLCCGLGGIVLWAKGRGTKLQFGLSLRRKDLPLLVFAIASTFFVAWIAFQNALHDERVVQGHPAMVESMLRDTYPLYFLPFPEIPNKYHVGFNVVAALFSRAFGLPGYQGVDVAAVFIWVGLIGALTAFLSDLKVPRGLLGIAVAFIMFTGGLSWLLGGHDVNQFQVPGWQVVSVAGRWAHYHFLFYFYQHPMSIGALLFVGTVSIFRRWSESGEFWLLTAGTVSLGALSLAHVMFFATLLASLGLLFFILLLRNPAKIPATALTGLFVFFVSVALAIALGGFFQLPSPNFDSEAMKFAWPPGYLRYEYFGSKFPMTSGQALLWYLDGFGTLLLVLPFGLWAACRDKRPVLWLLGIYCVLSWLIPQWIYYAYSSNIQKWFLGFEFSGKILCVAMLLPVCEGKRWRQALAYAFVLFSMASPVLFVYGMTFKDPAKLNWGERRAYYNRHIRPSGPFLQVLNLLKAQVHDLGMTWSTGGTARYLAVYAGYPVLEPDNVVSMPVARAKIAERRQQIQQLFDHPTDELLKALGIRWIIFTCEEMAKLPDATKVYLNQLKQRPGVEDLSVGGTAPGCFMVLKTPKT